MSSSNECHCPNCGSEFLSSIIFWKPSRQTTYFIDAYKCGDCGYAWDTASNSSIDGDYEPPRVISKCKLAPGQMDLIGNIKNIRDIIKPVPRYVRSPSGNSMITYRVPSHSTKQYKKEIAKMAAEMSGYKVSRNIPYWYKYRDIKRVNDRVETGHVKVQLGSTPEEQWTELELMYSDKPDLKIKESDNFYQVSYKKQETRQRKGHRARKGVECEATTK